MFSSHIYKISPQTLVFHQYVYLPTVTDQYYDNDSDNEDNAVQPSGSVFQGTNGKVKFWLDDETWDCLQPLSRDTVRHNPN